MQQRWREAAAARGIDVSEWRDAAVERGPSEAPEGLNIDEALRDARERVSEPEAVFAHGEILRHTLRLTLGRADADQVEEAVRLAARDGQLIRADDGDVRRWTTPKARAQEQRAVEAVLNGASKPILSEREAHAAALTPARFTDGQRKATEFVLASPERYKAVLGRPGTGKTTMLAVVREHAENKGVVVRGMAQNAAAARNLESEAGIRSSTIHKHLREVGPDIVRAKRGQNHWWTDLLKPRELWIVDEASQLPNALLSRLVWAAEAKGADVLFVGDNKQLAAIEAGRPFDLLLQKGIRHVEMDQILRQRNPEDLAAVRAAIRGDVRGALENLGTRVQSVPDREDRLQAMVMQWARRPELRDDTILLTSRNQDRIVLNEAVRDVLRAEGTLGPETPRVTLEKIHGTRADSREVHQYAVGQVLQYPAGVKARGIA